ncbi:MAG TPA: hypothetical protein VF198_05400 [Vicinamibacterales bacterium]
MRIVLALLMAGHGIAHLPGFLVSWQLRAFPEMPFRTTIFGASLDVGEAGIRMIGALWLVVAVSFLVVAGATLVRASWWLSFASVLIALSTLLCLAGWPDARLGLVANAAVLLLIVAGVRVGWL